MRHRQGAKTHTWYSFVTRYIESKCNYKKKQERSMATHMLVHILNLYVHPDIEQMSNFETN